MNADPKQPLYIAPEERVTLEQLKQRAEAVSNLAVSETKRISDLAVSESKRITNEVAEQPVTTVVLVAVGVVVVAASLAYFLGTRAGRRVSAARAPQPRG